MNNIIAFAGLAAFALAAAASAGFTGIATNQTTVGDKIVTDVYATFSANPNGAVDVLLNIFNVNMTIDGGFGSLIHNDFVGGSWAPQFSANPSMDTFCVIGGEANFANTTNADPNWGALGFNQISMPADAGWFNSNPSNLQGMAQDVELINNCNEIYSGLATRIMRLVNLSVIYKEFTITGQYTNYHGLGTPAEKGTFRYSGFLDICPSPSALALFGLAGLAGGRRRRA